MAFDRLLTSVITTNNKGITMPDGTTSVIMTALHSAFDALKFVWFALIGLIVWNGKRMVKKVDELERCAVNKDEFNDTLRSLRGDIHDLGEKQIDLHRTMRSDTREDIKGVHGRIDEMMKR